MTSAIPSPARALRGKGDLRTLMAAMDHQDISSTVRYAHMSRGQTKEMRSSVAVIRTPKGDNIVPMKKEENRS
jgi:hypothetical protein